MDIRTRHRDAQSAFLAVIQRRYDDAADLIALILADDADDPDAHLAWGELLLAQGRIEDAVVALKRAAELDPRNPKAHFSHGTALIELASRELVYFRRAAWSEAHDAICAGLELAPNDIAGQLPLQQVEQALDDDAEESSARSAMELILRSHLR